jgi:hypothetical protein
VSLWLILLIVLFVIALLGALTLWVSSRRVFEQRAESWPTIIAKIENVYVDYLPREVRSRRLRDYGAQKSNVVLAYSYSVADTYYSGKIRLDADEPYISKIEKELVGTQINIRYNPDKSEESIFLDETIQDWSVVGDYRSKPWTWLANYLDY